MTNINHEDATENEVVNHATPPTVRFARFRYARRKIAFMFVFEIFCGTVIPYALSGGPTPSFLLVCEASALFDLVLLLVAFTVDYFRPLQYDASDPVFSKEVAEQERSAGVKRPYNGLNCSRFRCNSEECTRANCDCLCHLPMSGHDPDETYWERCEKHMSNPLRQWPCMKKIYSDSSMGAHVARLNHENEKHFTL